ncbi:hypothetical protein JL722_5238 [Aureococcus anophagefferens]|nr:hypothetical protein JL722_5238 [Aureococcus anophagefferens]
MIVRIAETEYDVDEAVVFDDHRALPSLLADFRELNVDWPSLGFDGCASADCAAAGLLAELRRRRVTVADDARGLIVKIAAVGEILVPRDARGSPPTEGDVSTALRAWGVDGARDRKFYDPAAQELVSGNHVIHNDAAEYWGMILKPVVRDPRVWRGKRALDVACGGGRNVANLLRLAAWDRDGCDLMVYRAPHEAPLDPARHAPYDANVFDANGTNSDHDVRVTDLDRVVEDLEDIGFVDVEYEVGGWHLGYVVSYPDQWLIVYARKPGPATEQRV